MLKSNGKIHCSKCGHEKLFFGNPCPNCHKPPEFKKGDRVMQISGRYKWARSERSYLVAKREGKVLHITIAERCTALARAWDFRLATDEELENEAADRFMEGL